MVIRRAHLVDPEPKAKPAMTIVCSLVHRKPCYFIR